MEPPRAGLITLVLAHAAGYALARMRGRWTHTQGIAIFLTYLVPPTIPIIPFSRIIAWLGLQGWLWSLVLVYPSLTVPFCTWPLMGFFKAIPRDLEEAAMVDGLSRFAAFVKVVLPISVAGVLTAVIFTFTLVTQEFVYGVTFITSTADYTGERRRPDLPGARRRLLLGIAHGCVPHHECPNRRDLQFVRRSVRGWHHSRRHQVNAAVHHDRSAVLPPAGPLSSPRSPTPRKSLRTSNLDETVNEVLRFAKESIICHVPGIGAGNVARIATKGQLA
jgi:binding-protein-dependent transport system inner membrane component